MRALPNSYGVVALFDLTLRAVEGAGFEEDDRVVVPDGGDHHALRVVGRYRGDDLEAGEVSVEGLQGVGVLGGELDAAAVGAADDQRDLLPARRRSSGPWRRSG